MKILLQLIKTDQQLVKDLLISVDEAVHKKGNKVSHLRLARPTKQGWFFLKKKNISWTILEDVMHDTIKRHPHCHRAKIAEVVSRFINLSEKEISILRAAVL